MLGWKTIVVDLLVVGVVVAAAAALLLVAAVAFSTRMVEEVVIYWIEECFLAVVVDLIVDLHLVVIKPKWLDLEKGTIAWQCPLPMVYYDETLLSCRHYSLC